MDGNKFVKGLKNPRKAIDFLSTNLKKKFIATTLKFQKERLKEIRFDKNQKMFVNPWRSHQGLCLYSRSLGIKYTIPEFDNIYYLCKILKRGMVVFDIGANWGWHSLLAAKRVEETGKVFSFEPNRYNYEILQRNVRLNGYNNIECIRKGVSDKNEKTKLFLSSTDCGSHSLAKREEVEDYEFVELIRLDDFVEERGIKSIDIIKIDVEGAEGKVLRGMTERLKFCKVIFLDLHPTILPAFGDDRFSIINQLEKYGFDIYRIQNKKLLKIEKEIDIPKNYLRILALSNKFGNFGDTYG
jgi:FkbM family methyltransferase